MNMQTSAIRELVLLRHAKSAWDSDAPSDFERPLSPRGRRDAPRIARWMHDQGLLPDLVLSSPAHRARDTAELVLKTLGIGSDRLHWEPHLYAATVPDLLAAIATVPDGVHRLLLVGHNPGLEDLVLRLVPADDLPVSGEGFLKTATVAVVRWSGTWDQPPRESGRLTRLMRPKQLPRKYDPR